MITAFELRFKYLPAIFRAMPDDDTLSVRLETLVADPDEDLLVIDHIAPWVEVIGLSICWAWQLTNQQGYVDGARLEFCEPGQASRAVIEFVVVASTVQVFAFAAADMRQQFESTQ
jgi:Family of unknown function (DUF6334)